METYMLYEFHCFEFCDYEPNPISHLDPSLCPSLYDDIVDLQE
jgi:hypothetical protein